MANVAYNTSEGGVCRGQIQRAHIPAKEEPVYFGIHTDIAEHYSVSADVEEPHPSTLDHLVAAAGGRLLETFQGALPARPVYFDNL